jgi:hypothetical protein
MQFYECIGKIVKRTKPAKHGDPSYQDTPIKVYSIKNGKMIIDIDPLDLLPFDCDVSELDEKWQDDGWELFDTKSYYESIYGKCFNNI